MGRESSTRKKGDKRAYMVLVVKPEGKRQVERIRRRCEGNIKMELK
jgi:hypothetical protein